MKLKNFVQKNIIYILSALIPFALMMIIFIVNGIYPFGDRSFLHIDMYHQYFPFLTEFYHKIQNGESLFYSFQTGIGSNFLALFVYYLASPFNWLCLLFPEHLLIEFMSYFVVLKIGACGFTFSYYLKKHFNSNSLTIVFFATFYALSGYMAAYNWNVMWLDCVVLAPLIILGLEKLVNEGKYKLYCITLALAILSNYYICIMICIYLVLYFLVLLLRAKNKGRAILRFAWFSLLAGGMAAILLLPELFALHYTEFSNFDFPNKMTQYFPLIDVLARHSINVPVETGLDHWPNIYCGVAVFLLLPLYVIKKEVPLSEKLPKLALLGFLILSFSTNTLNFIWHGLNYPDSLPCRQSFLYVILLLTVCFESLRDIQKYNKKTLGICFFGSFCFLLLCDKLLDTEMFTYSIFLITLVLLSLYALFFFWLKDSPKHKSKIMLLALAVVMLEAGINTFVTSVPTVSRTNYLKSYDDYYILMDRLAQKDAGFYRVEKFKRVTKNDGMLLSYPSASLFSSTSNAHVKEFYGKYGMQNSKVFYNYDGSTPLTSALLQVNYMISKEKLEEDSRYTLIDSSGDLFLYESNYKLPFGFFVSTDTEGKSDMDQLSLSRLFGDIDALEETIKEETAEEQAEEALTPLNIQNRLVSALTGESSLFTSLPMTERVSDAETLITLNEDGYVYAFTDSSKVTEVEAHFTNGDGQKSFTKMKNEYIMDLGYHYAGESITLTSKDSAAMTVSAYLLREDVLDRFLTELSQTSLTLDSFDSSHINGHITVPEDGELVLSVPYEPGWTLKVDGAEINPHIFEDTFISVPLSQGEHTVSLSYYPAGLTLGIVISILSLAAFIFTVFFLKKKESNN